MTLKHLYGGQLNHSQVDQQKVLENNIDYWELEL